MALGLAQVEAALAGLHDVSAEKRRAFQGRVKHLQKLGFPAGINTGKGKRAEYTLEACCKLIAAFELMQFGAMPAAAIGIVESNWSFLKVMFAAAYVEYLERGWPDEGGFGYSWVWVLYPQMMADLADPDDPDTAAVSALRLKDVEKEIWADWHANAEGHVPDKGKAYRLSLINISWAMHEFFIPLVAQGLPKTLLFEELQQWKFESYEINMLKDDIGKWSWHFFEQRLNDE